MPSFIQIGSVVSEISLSTDFKDCSFEKTAFKAKKAFH